MSAQAQPPAELLLALADDELVLGWRDSEWTGIAPLLEEDVAFSSIAQNEIGHARALYQLAAGQLGGDADSIAFDRSPEDYRCCPLVELRELDWARTIARHYLYETADAIRIERVAAGEWPELAALARKIAREEAYHRLHAEMWVDRLAGAAEARARLAAALDELWPYALGMLAGEEREELRRRVAARLRFFDATAAEPPAEACRGAHSAELAGLWQEMTMVRRSLPGARW